MSAQADQVCGAGYGQRTAQRVNRRNGCRVRERDTRVGAVDLAIPKLGESSYYPDWSLTHPHRAEQSLVTLVATGVNADGPALSQCRSGWAASSSSARSQRAGSNHTGTAVGHHGARPAITL